MKGERKDLAVNKESEGINCAVILNMNEAAGLFNYSDVKKELFAKTVRNIVSIKNVAEEINKELKEAAEKCKPEGYDKLVEEVQQLTQLGKEADQETLRAKTKKLNVKTSIYNIKFLEMREEILFGKKPLKVDLFTEDELYGILLRDITKVVEIDVEEKKETKEIVTNRPTREMLYALSFITKK